MTHTQGKHEGSSIVTLGTVDPMALKLLLAERDALKQQVQIWKLEANAHKATVHEAYQVCTGNTGEPGDWNGAAPIRALAAERDALKQQNKELLEALKAIRNEELGNSYRMQRIAIEAIARAEKGQTT